MPPEKRERCQVPGCPNSSARYARLNCEYLCSPHWRLVPKKLKRARTELVRELVKAGECERPSGETYRPLTIKAGWRMYQAWRRMVHAATEGQAGI